MFYRIKIFLLYSLLVVSGPLLLVMLIEVGLRAAVAYQQNSTDSLATQLEAARNTKPEDIGDAPTIGGLVMPSAHSDIVYELKRNVAGTFLKKPFRFNAVGLREREFPLEKPQGTTRIIGIGDSVMFGWGIEQDKTYLRLLENQLHAAFPDRKFETINFGVPGYNTAMEVATLEHKALGFDPDLVVIHYVENDLGVPEFMQPPNDPLDIRRSFFVEFVREKLGAMKLMQRKLLPAQLKNLSGKERWAVLDQYRHMVGPDGVRNAFKKLHQLTAPRKIPVLLVISNAKGESREIVLSAVEKYGFHLVEVGPSVTKYFIDNNIEDTKARRRKLLWVSPLDSHPNLLGHEIYANAISPVLLPLLASQ